MHQIVQQIVDGMILVMGSMLLLFTLALLALHFITNATQERMQRIRREVLRLISVEEQIRHLRLQIYRVVSGEAGERTLRGIRGIRSQRGLQVLELVSREVEGERLCALRSAVEEDFYAACLTKKLRGRSMDAALLGEKLVGQLSVPGYGADIERNLRRWPEDAAAQEIGLLALLRLGEGERAERLLTDPDFRVVLSFRTLHELFRHYSGDRAALYRKLLHGAKDQYVRRSCIRGIGEDGCRELAGLIFPELQSPHLNVLLETVRTLGKLRYAPATEAVRALTAHPAWEVRCAAVDALRALAGEDCRAAVVPCLRDGVWWVRFHAAEALATLACREEVLAEVRAGGDRYAREMLEYVIARDEILRGEAAV